MDNGTKTKQGRYSTKVNATTSRRELCDWGASRVGLTVIFWKRGSRAGVASDPLPGYGVGEEEVRTRWRGIRAFWREPVIQRTHTQMYL